MRRKRFDKCISLDPYAAMSLALSKYHFASADISEIIRHVLGHAPSTQSTCRLSSSDGSKLKRGRPRTVPKVEGTDLYSLIEATGKEFDTFGGNTFHFLHFIELQFGLSPRQYLNWVTSFVRHGRYMMRSCLFCGDLFPSMDSGDRHCRACRVNRRRILKRNDNSNSAGLEGMTASLS